MAKTPQAIAPIRDDWSIHIRTDNGDPEIEVQSEYAFRTSEGVRHIISGLPKLSSPLSEIESEPVTLNDGHETTFGACVQALRDAARDAIDAHEDDLPDDPAERKPAAFHEKLGKFRAARAEATDASTAPQPNKWR